MKKLLVFVVISMWLIACNTSQQPELLTVPFQSQLDGSLRNYYIYLPKGYDQNSDKKWPVMMFLHGNGERGDGNNQLEFVLTHGPLYEAWIQKRDLPFIIISPQLPLFDFAKDPSSYFNTRSVSSIPVRLDNDVPARIAESKMSGVIKNKPPVDDMSEVAPLLPKGWEMIEADLLAMLNNAHTQYNTNKKKVYLTGLSYGGFGTWYMASKHASTFAAIAPVAGWGHPQFMDNIAKYSLPVWAFAGGKDPVIGLEYFYAGINKLNNLGHNEVRFTVHQNAGHDVWRRVYQSEFLYDWLLDYELD